MFITCKAAGGLFSEHSMTSNILSFVPFLCFSNNFSICCAQGTFTYISSLTAHNSPAQETLIFMGRGGYEGHPAGEPSLFSIAVLLLVLLMYDHDPTTTVLCLLAQLSLPLLNLTVISHAGPLHLDVLEARETQYTLDQCHLLSSPKLILTLLFQIPADSPPTDNPARSALVPLSFSLTLNQPSFLFPTFISKPLSSLHVHEYNPDPGSHLLSAAYCISLSSSLTSTPFQSIVQATACRIF